MSTKWFKDQSHNKDHDLHIKVHAVSGTGTVITVYSKLHSVNYKWVK